MKPLRLAFSALVAAWLNPITLPWPRAALGTFGPEKSLDVSDLGKFLATDAQMLLNQRDDLRCR